ncbi:hypothetical protein Mal48_43670 [Thalassoglobus polymorphus]|uniref:Uncharacterized protein n=2 Tax=Thalassoglobus polymorphus TaxID=2527994 RepID=A0A517QU04_9PLAN|nr:hypothetical protein Mal48_43670 [Thalassoglobus polymorphus]
MRTSRKTLVLIVVGTLCSGSVGCALDRTSFQMNSNSPMPFFGFDFRLPRKTSQVETLSHEEQLATNWDNQEVVRPVSHKKSSAPTQPATQRLQLPKISTLLESGQEEELSFTGPKAPFTR